MFNNGTFMEEYSKDRYFRDNYVARGALEIAIRAREQERKLAIMNAENDAERSIQREQRPNLLRSLVTSLLSLTR